MADQHEFVYVRLAEHDSSVPPGRVTRQAFDEVWSKRGHVIVDEEEGALLSSPATMAEMEQAEPVEPGKASRSTKKGA